MRFQWLAAAALVFSMLAAPAPARAAGDATLFRLFLKDGTTIVSYGEFARVGDRVVFSLPTASTPDPPLQLVTIAADRVDWDRTYRYSEAARASHYIATRAEDDYAVLTNQVAQTLNEVANTTDASKRLDIVERARRTLASWPAEHFNYRFADVRQMLGMLDEAIADLRTAAGKGRFDLSLVAYGTPPPSTEPLLPPPTPKDAIEQALTVARLVDSPAERTALLSAAVTEIDRAKGTVPADWAAATRADAVKAIDTEVASDRAYEALREQVVGDAAAHAKMADVVGVQRIVSLVSTRDAALGNRRPQVVDDIVAEVNRQLDAARRLRLARDRWALRLPVVRRYRVRMREPLNLFASLEPSLDNIKALAGSTPASLAAVHRRVGEIVKELRSIAPPDELKGAHALLMSAVTMADRAAAIRHDATLAGDMARAWDASSAAAGAMMLASQARAQIQSMLKRPELP